MSFPKVLVVLFVVVFGTIAVLGWMKQGKNNSKQQPNSREVELEISGVQSRSFETFEENQVQAASQRVYPPLSKDPVYDEVSKAEVDRIDEFFNLGMPQLPIVETITYHSKVSWLQGKPAWIADYASYYGTSRHFIARSLNKKPDYLTQNVKEGDRFNVFRKDRDIRFYLLLDTTRCKMWFYYLDGNERVLVKTYHVGLGRLDSRRASGCLTPLGKYTLGNKIAIFKPGMISDYQNQQTEMIRIFGTRWVPFDKEIANCTDSAKGFGIHGVPWASNARGELVENNSGISKYESDGCVRLRTNDMEELFAIIITKPTVIEIVRDITDIQLPGRPSAE